MKVDTRYVSPVFAARVGMAMIGALTAAPALATLGFGAAGVVASSCTQVPMVSGVTTGNGAHYGPPGSRVTVQAPAPALFSQPGLAPSVQVGSASIPASGLAVAADGSSLSFTLPGNGSGAVTVTMAGPLGACEISNTNYDFIQLPAASVATPAPSVGSVVRVGGSAFSPFAPGGLPGTAVVASYSNCLGSSQQWHAAVATDSVLTAPAPTAYCNGPLNLMFTAPYNTVSGALDPPIVMGVNAGGVDVSPVIATVQPAAASPGQVITVTGSGFGDSGAATLAGVPAAVSWSDTQLVATVPVNASTGTLNFTRASDGAQYSAGTITVPTPGVTPPSPGGSLPAPGSGVPTPGGGLPNPDPGTGPSIPAVGFTDPVSPNPSGSGSPPGSPSSPSGPGGGTSNSGGSPGPCRIANCDLAAADGANGWLPQAGGGSAAGQSVLSGPVVTRGTAVGSATPGSASLPALGGAFIGSSGPIVPWSWAHGDPGSPSGPIFACLLLLGVAIVASSIAFGIHRGVLPLK